MWLLIAAAVINFSLSISNTTYSGVTPTGTFTSRIEITGGSDNSVTGVSMNDGLYVSLGATSDAPILTVVLQGPGGGGTSAATRVFSAIH